MKCILAIAVLLLTCSLSFAQPKEVCFSIDDLPVVNYGVNDTAFQAMIFTKLVNSFSKNQIPAVGSVIAKKLCDSTGAISPFQVSLLRRWTHHGLGVANHSFSHPDFNNLSSQDYFNDILKGEKVLNELSQAEKVRYFRHPFLHVGNTRAKADSLEQFLAAHGYTVAPVTIDTDDYLFAHAFQRAKLKQDSTLAARIGHDYLLYMEAKLHYYERQAQALFGRDIRQILLFHASWLNAEYLDSLAAIYRHNGYRFVTMHRALADDIYRTPVTVYGKWGISWLDRWALSEGKTREFFKDEPDVPDYIRELSSHD